ncbi:NADH dehydrogenase I chain C; chain D [Salmonella enterica]|nr:NADH dehydrogenase I chain C; chain D [Salmonella enterica]
MTDLTAQDAAWSTRDHLDDPVIGELRNRFGPDAFTVQATRTGIPVVWVKREQLLEVGDFLKKLPKPYVMLFDLHGMDERLRTHRDGLPAADFSVFYHLISIERNRDIMLKVALSENDLRVPTFTKLFPNANWYERETWEMFGIDIEGHPHLTRIMMPQTWEGHPLRKDYPARATEFDPFELTKAKQDLEMEALTFKPEDWGMKRGLTTRTLCSSTSARTTRLRTVRFVLSCNLTAKKSSTACRISVITTAAAEKNGRAPVLA